MSSLAISVPNLLILRWLKRRQEGRRVALLPPASHLGQYLFAILCHVGDHLARSARVLVLRSPYQQLQHDRRKINALRGEAIVQLATVQRIGFDGNDTRRPQALETIRQYVRRNAFAGVLKLLERVISANHQIADDQQRPAVPDFLQRDADRDIPNGDGGFGLCRSSRQSIKSRLQIASEWDELQEDGEEWQFWTSVEQCANTPPGQRWPNGAPDSGACDSGAPDLVMLRNYFLASGGDGLA